MDTKEPDGKAVTGLKDFGQKTWAFAHESWKDKEFWVQGSAMNAGATLLIGSVAGLFHLGALPFLVTAAGVAACSALIVVGVYGIYTGGMAWCRSLKNDYSKVFGKNNPSKKRKELPKTLLQKLAEDPRFKKIAQKPLAQKFLNSWAGKISRRLLKKHQAIFLASLSLLGASSSIAISTASLAHQALTLSAFTAGSLLTISNGAIIAFGIMGVYGAYLGIRSLVHHSLSNDGGTKAALSVPPPTASRQQAPSLTPTFAKAAPATEEKPVNPAPVLAKTPPPAL